MSSPLLSIITINLNQAAGLQRTLQSVQAQSWQQFECIVVDGDSSDDSKKIIESFSDIISQSISEKDEGIYHAMNKGWQMASGRYCLFLNAGDTLHHASVLEKVSAILALGHAQFYYGDMMGVGLDGTRAINHYHEPVSLQYLFRWYLPHPASFIERSLLVQLQGYAQHYGIISDWLFCVQAFLRGSVFEHLPITVADFYTDGVSSTQHPKAASEKKAVFERELAFLKPDWQWYQQMRTLELSRPVQWMAKLIRVFKKS
jgi:glycosyltransferase involved in cell wall biosynthesis